MGVNQLPTPLKAARWCLYIVGGLTVAVGLGGLLADGISGATLGAFTWMVFPGVLSLVFASRIAKGTRVLFWSIIGLQALQLLLSLSSLGAGDPRGLTQAVLPIAVLVLITRPASRAHFSR